MIQGQHSSRRCPCVLIVPMLHRLQARLMRTLLPMSMAAVLRPSEPVRVWCLPGPFSLVVPLISTEELRKQEQ